MKQTKRIFILLNAAMLMLGTACGQIPKPESQTGGSDADISAEASAEETDTGSAAEQTADLTDTTASAAQTTEQTTADTPAAATSTTHGIGINRSALPDTAALEQDVSQYKRGCAVLLESLDGTELYSYHPDTLIPGASLIKLPYVYYCCTQPLP